MTRNNSKQFGKLHAEFIRLRLQLIRTELSLGNTLAKMAADKKNGGQSADCARLKSEAQMAEKKVNEYLSEKGIPLPSAEVSEFRSELEKLKDLIAPL